MLNLKYLTRLYQGLKFAGAHSPMAPKIWCGLLKLQLFCIDPYVLATKILDVGKQARNLKFIPCFKFT